MKTPTPPDKNHTRWQSAVANAVAVASYLFGFVIFLLKPDLIFGETLIGHEADNYFGGFILSFLATIFLGALRANIWLVGVLSIFVPFAAVFIPHMVAEFLPWAIVLAFWTVGPAFFTGLVGAVLGKAMVGAYDSRGKREDENGSVHKKSLRDYFAVAETTIFGNVRWIARVACVALFASFIIVYAAKDIGRSIESKAKDFVLANEAVRNAVCGTPSADSNTLQTAETFLPPSSIVFNVTGTTRTANVELNILGSKRDPQFTIKSIKLADSVRKSEDCSEHRELIDD